MRNSAVDPPALSEAAADVVHLIQAYSTSSTALEPLVAAAQQLNKRVVDAKQVKRRGDSMFIG